MEWAVDLLCLSGINYEAVNDNHLQQAVIKKTTPQNTQTQT